MFKKIPDPEHAEALLRIKTILERKGYNINNLLEVYYFWITLSDEIYKVPFAHIPIDNIEARHIVEKYLNEVELFGEDSKDVNN